MMLLSLTGSSLGYAATNNELPSTLKPLVIHQRPIFSTPTGYLDELDEFKTTWPQANPFPRHNTVTTTMPSLPAIAPEPGVPCHSGPVSLWGLEGQRVFRSPVCASPTGQWVAYSEMVYLPALRQTSATVFLLPVLPAPQPGPPPIRPRTWWERHLWDHLEPPPSPPPDFSVRNTNPSYLQQRAIPLLKLTFQPPFEFSTLQAERWSQDGTQLWVVQKTGVLHKGWQIKRRWHLDMREPAIHHQRLPLEAEPWPEGLTPLPLETAE
jgi:hypothetical protein